MISSNNNTNSQSIQKITPANINFSRIHMHCKKDHGIWQDLGRGKAILNSPEQLAQYFHSYGSMVSQQWNEIKNALHINPQHLDIIDYGCGQGVGTIQIFDHLRLGGMPNCTDQAFESIIKKNLLKTVSNVNLIEPSGIALSKAYKILDFYPTNSVFNCINKKLDDLNIKDLNISKSSTKLHLFSNILDIDTFDQLALVKKVLSIKDNHYILAVSPTRSDGGKRMQDTFKNLIENNNVHSSEKWSFTYLTQANQLQPHNAFIIHLEV